jgi:DNA-binding transcriptional LysR family regulator
MQPTNENALWARRLKVRHLESFLVMARCATLTEAAEVMHMTQSAMSHWLAELESVVGSVLVKRGRRVQLTAAGQAVQRLALRVLGDMERTRQELDSIARGAVGRLHVGTVTSGMAGLLPNAISAFQQVFPDVAISVIEGHFDSLLEGIEKRNVDVAIGTIDDRAHREGLLNEILMQDEMAVVVGAEHPISTRQDVDWKDLYEYRWIMPPRGTLMRTRLDAVLLAQGGAGILPKVETGSVLTIEALLRRGNYVSVLSGGIAMHLQALGLLTIVPLATKAALAPVGMVWNASGQHEILEAFLSSLREEARRGAPESD